MHCSKTAWVAAPLSLTVVAAAQAQEVNDERGVQQAPVKLSAGDTSVTIGVFAGRAMTGAREVGGHVIVDLPFGRLFGASQGLWRLAAPPNSMEGSPPTPPRVTQKPRIAVPPSLARACVRSAWRAHGVADLHKLDRMRARAQTSALLPEARFQMARDWDQSYRLSPTTDDPYRLQETNGGGRTVEGRLTWKLNRLLFVDEELSMERLQLQRVRLRSQLAGQVLSALFDWQRSRLALSTPDLDDQERVEQASREAEAASLLDVLTQGWFSAWLAAGTPR